MYIHNTFRSKKGLSPLHHTQRHFIPSDEHFQCRKRKRRQDALGRVSMMGNEPCCPFYCKRICKSTETCKYSRIFMAIEELKIYCSIQELSVPCIYSWTSKALGRNSVSSNNRAGQASRSAVCFDSILLKARIAGQSLYLPAHRRQCARR